MDRHRADHRRIAKLGYELDEARSALAASTVQAGVLGQRVDALETRLRTECAIVLESKAYHDGIRAREEADGLRIQYEAKCEEVDALEARLAEGDAAAREQGKIAYSLGASESGAAEIESLRREVAEAKLDHVATAKALAMTERERDDANHERKEALVDLARVRASFEAQRKALCDRLNLDAAAATWADITKAIR